MSVEQDSGREVPFTTQALFGQALARQWDVKSGRQAAVNRVQPKAKLRLIISDDRSDQIDARAAEQVKAVEYFDGPAQVLVAAIEVLAKAKLGGRKFITPDRNLIGRGTGVGEGSADFHSNAVERARALGDRLPEAVHHVHE